MFDEKYLMNEELRPILEYIQELDDLIELAIEEEMYEYAFEPALELRHIVNEHFPSHHVYRALASYRVGFLYYLIGFGKESKQELKRAMRILDRYPEEFVCERFAIRHLYYHAAKLTGNKDEIIKASEILLNDPCLNTRLEIRIYLNLARQYAFGKGKHLGLMDKYLTKAKTLLTIYNLTDSIDYQEALYLSAIYAMEIDDPYTALKLSEYLQNTIDVEGEESDGRIKQLYHSVKRLIKMLEHQLEGTSQHQETRWVN